MRAGKIKFLGSSFVNVKYVLDAYGRTNGKMDGWKNQGTKIGSLWSSGQVSSFRAIELARLCPACRLNQARFSKTAEAFSLYMLLLVRVQE